MTSEEIDTREDFENCFLHFVEALRVLSHDAATQCEEMGNYNAPWEIKDNAYSQGLASLRMSALYLSWEQAEQIVDLVAALKQLPKEAIAPPDMLTTNHIGSITAMNHPAWESLRKDAKELLASLEPAVHKNEIYFQIGSGS